MFPDDRLVLGIFSPVLGLFFGVCVYFTSFWEPSSVGDKIGKCVVEDVLFTFLTLCGVGFVASLVGPTRIQPLITRVGGKAVLAGLALILGTVVYVIYSCLT